MINIDEHIGLVHHIIKKEYIKKKWWHTEYYDDLVQMGTIGLWQAAKTFNVELGFKFGTYAVRQVKWHIDKGLELVLFDYSLVSLTQDEEIDLSLNEYISTNWDYTTPILVEQLFSKLSGRCYDVMYDTYVLGMSAPNAAIKHNISRATIERLRESGLAKMREIIT